MEINLETSDIIKEICFICNMNKINTILSCKHELCRYCLKRLTKLECPFCRKDISNEFNIQAKKYSIDDYVSQDTTNLILNEDRRRENERNYVNHIISNSYERPSFLDNFVDENIENYDNYLIRFTKTGRRIQQRENERRRVREEKSIEDIRKEREKIRIEKVIRENRDIKYDYYTNEELMFE
jgi:hypothetical protein